MNVDTCVVRIGAALKVAQMLRSAIEKNNNVYSGLLVPNIQSIVDTLSLPENILMDQIEKHAELQCTQEELDTLKECLS